MNLNIVFGSGLISLIIYFTIFKGVNNPSLFLNSHAITLVLGGTIAVMIISSTTKQIKSIFSLLIYGVIFKKKFQRNDVAISLVNDYFNFRNGTSLIKLSKKDTHPFIVEAYKIMTENILPAESIIDILNKRKNFFKQSYADDAKLLTGLAKYPPALGLLGATHGMITMMSNFGSGGKDQIGAGMAVALVATLWGIGISNLIILPIADYTDRLAVEDSRLRELIVEGLSMIIRNESPDVMSEKLNSLINIDERMRIFKRATNLQA